MIDKKKNTFQKKIIYISRVKITQKNSAIYLKLKSTRIFQLMKRMKVKNIAERKFGGKNNLSKRKHNNIIQNINLFFISKFILRFSFVYKVCN